MQKDSDCNFDLEYILKVGQDYKLNKNDRIKDIYESNFEEVPLPEETPQFQEENIAQCVLKQYLSSMVYPSTRPKDNQQLPNIGLQLEFVNGYSCLQSTQNVFYVGNDEILFPAAILGVVMNTKTRKQRFYGVHGQHTPETNFDQFHRGPIVSVTFDEGKKWVATGSMGLNPEICVWEAETFKFVSKFNQGKKSKAIGLIRFFMEAKYILTVQRAHKQNNIHLWTIEGEHKQVLNVEGSIYGISSWNNMFAVASYKRAIQFQYDQTSNTFKQTNLKEEFCTSIAYLEGVPIYGNCYGTIYYKQNSLKIDEGPIFCITVKDGLIYTSGSQNKKVIVLNQQFQRTRQIQLVECARSLDVRGTTIVAGLRNGTIVQITGEEVSVVLTTHVSGSLYGLCYDKQRKLFVTAGDDNRILCFDPESKQVVETHCISHKNEINKLYERNKLNPFPCSKQSRAVAMHGDKMAYATNNAQLYLRVVGTQGVVSCVQLKDKAQVIRFSCDGQVLAAGCHNDCIYLFDVSEEGIKETGVLSGHQGYINDLDFSLDGRFLRSAGVQGELRYWDLQSLKELVLNSKNVRTQTLQQIKDSDWVGVCRFSWQTSSIWKQNLDFQFINRMSLSDSENYLALGEDDNCIRLYRVPSGKFRKFRGHANHVMNVCWSDEDQYLASVGGSDRCLMIWRVKEFQ